MGALDGFFETGALDGFLLTGVFDGFLVVVVAAWLNDPNIATNKTKIMNDFENIFSSR